MTSIGTQAISTTPVKRPAINVALPTGRESSTSIIRARASRARTSNARKTIANMKVAITMKLLAEIRKRGFRKPNVEDRPENMPCRTT